MYGFIRVACASPNVTLANCTENAKNIIAFIKKAQTDNAAVLVFPELCITGYTCSDLFLQRTTQTSALQALNEIANYTSNCSTIVIVGLPFAFESALYNVAAICANGRVLAIVPKTNIPNYAEFYERRHFAPAFDGLKQAFISSKTQEGLDETYPVPFGTNILFYDTDNPDLQLAIEICEDAWVPSPPSVQHAQNGALIIANLSASNETIGKSDYRKLLVQSHSARLICAYLYADAGQGESTTDIVFASHNIISENGTTLAETPPFGTNTYCIADIDTEKLLQERRRTTSFTNCKNTTQMPYLKIPIKCNSLNSKLLRNIDSRPFVPSTKKNLAERCKEIVQIQTAGLVQRLRHTSSSQAVIGISGGLDSALALIITTEAFKQLSLDLSDIVAVTMPCFGTTDRTYNNACSLVKEIGASLREIRIEKAVLQHFSDIGHNPLDHSITYENSQARERTQVLMDIANSLNALVIGTGDLSELALGWATYNGDHMSMYGVNASIPKTLVRHLVSYYAQKTEQDGNKKLSAILLDILDTPVSPELLPAKNGKISQNTEEIVGPYELHDFFLYYVMRWGFSPDKILFLAKHAFKCGTKTEEYSEDTIKKWLAVFIRRFFSQQFKRSCLPDGPKVGSVSLSPRGDWRMPSDANANEWLDTLNK